MGTTRKAIIVTVQLVALLVAALTAYVLARAPILFDAAAMIAKSDALVLFIGTSVTAALLVLSLILTATTPRTTAPARVAPHPLAATPAAAPDATYQEQYHDAADAAAIMPTPELLMRRSTVERLTVSAQPGTAEAVYALAWFHAYDQEMMRRALGPVVAS